VIRTVAASFAPHLASDPKDGAGQSPLGELTANLAAGSDAAWSQFHRDHGPGIFRQLLAASRGDHHLASEALQQTYLRVAKNVKTCDSEAMFSGWLRIVARSALNDCLRRRWSWGKLLNRRAVEPEGPEGQTADEVSLLSALDSALAQIAPEDRALLKSKYFAGADVNSIAEQLSISPKAAESRLTRARSQLRRLLEAVLKSND